MSILESQSADPENELELRIRDRAIGAITAGLSFYFEPNSPEKIAFLLYILDLGFEHLFFLEPAVKHQLAMSLLGEFARCRNITEMFLRVPTGTHAKKHSCLWELLGQSDATRECLVRDRILRILLDMQSNESDYYR
eukprot:84232_1